MQKSRGFTMLEKVEYVYKVSSGLNRISILFVYRRPDFLLDYGNLENCFPGSMLGCCNFF